MLPEKKNQDIFDQDWSFLNVLYEYNDLAAQELKRVWSHSAEVVTAGLDGLDEETTGSWVAVHSADEILHWRLMGQADEVTHMVDYQPGQMLWVMKVLTLLFQEKNQNEHVNLKFCVIKIFLRSSSICDLLQNMLTLLLWVSPHSHRKGWGPPCVRSLGWPWLTESQACPLLLPQRSEGSTALCKRGYVSWEKDGDRVGCHKILCRAHAQTGIHFGQYVALQIHFLMPCSLTIQDTSLCFFMIWHTWTIKV